MKLYMIRHGETNWNREFRIQGRSDIPLNEYGRELARVTSKALQSVPFTKAYTSPLKRASETAQIILSGHKIVPILDERIMEIGFGVNEGVSCGKSGYGGGVEFQKFFQSPAAYQAVEGGESIEGLLGRTDLFLKDLIQMHGSKQDEHILVSTHGATLAAMLTNIRKNPVEQLWGSGVHKNCAVTIVEVKEGIPTVLEEGKIYYN